MIISQHTYLISMWILVEEIYLSLCFRTTYFSCGSQVYTYICSPVTQNQLTASFSLLSAGITELFQTLEGS